jgi:hypothetical protein
MPTIGDLIQAEVERREAEVISNFLPQACRRSCVEHLAATLDVDAYRTTVSWTNLDDQSCRMQWFRSVLPGKASEIATGIATSWEDDFNAVLRSNGFRSERPKRLVRHIEPVVLRIIGSTAADATLGAALFPEAWALLADELAAQLFRQMNGTSPLSEWAVLNRLVTISFFVSCDLVRAEPVQNSLSELSRSLLGVRGSLVRLPEKVRESGVADVKPQSVALGGPITLTQRSLSSLLTACHDESHAAAVKKGIAQRVLNPHSHVPENVRLEIARRFPGQDPVRIVQDARATTYQQYNFTILSYAALCGIEQLLRGMAEQAGIAHVDHTGWLVGVTDWVESLGLPKGLQDRVEKIYSTDDANIRNRVMHGGLLDVEGQRTQNTARAIAQVSGPNTLPYSNENIASVCLQLLEDLDTEAAGRGLTPAHFGWVAQKTLSAAELAFADSLPNPLDWGMERAEAWRQRLFKYLSAFCPAANLSAKFGLHGWARHYHASDSFVQVLFLSLTFETLYRLTVHLLGEQVLQMAPSRDGLLRVFRYRMLDATDKGLCSANVLASLLGRIPVNERDAAKDAIDLAVKIRDAFAHGAVPNFSSAELDSTAHVFVYALDVLSGVGLRSLTETAAYYNWVNGGWRGDTEVADWLLAEKQIWERIQRISD